MTKIVVVDDEKGVRLSTRLALEEHGYIVFDFSNGKDAIDFMTAQEVDLLLLDIWMPEPDGIEVLKRLQKAGNSVPVLVITGSHGNMPISATESVALTYGAKDVLYKPFSDADLIRLVSQTVGS